MKAVCLSVALSVLAAAAGAQESSAPKKKLSKAEEKVRQQKIDALEPFNNLIAGWTAQGSPPGGAGANKGRWTEKTAWVWVLKGDVGVKFKTIDGKYLVEGFITYDPENDKFTCAGVRADKSKVTYTGEFADEKKKFILTGELPSKDNERITLNLLHSNRLLTVVEQGRAGKGMVVVAEIGATKDGDPIAARPGNDGPKCVITGGPGTAAVAHGGKTYYICCSGCRDAFADDPDKWIASAKKKGYIQ